MKKVHWNQIDWSLEAAPTWPVQVKVAVFIAIAISTFGLGYYFMIKPKLEDLEMLKVQERRLKQEFQEKWSRVANLPYYKEQLKAVNEIYQQLAFQLPTKEEMPGFLKDVSETAVSSGLDLLLFKPEEEIKHEFYAEIPIVLKAEGTFEEIGTFLSSLASLPRLITVEDIKISHKEKKNESNGLLKFEAILKTYRYLSEEERETKNVKRRKRRR